MEQNHQELIEDTNYCIYIECVNTFQSIEVNYIRSHTLQLYVPKLLTLVRLTRSFIFPEFEQLRQFHEMESVLKQQLSIKNEQTAFAVGKHMLFLAFDNAEIHRLDCINPLLTFAFAIFLPTAMELSENDTVLVHQKLDKFYKYLLKNVD